jgi:hypothetical protein
LENTPKVVDHIRRMGKKVNVYWDYRDFRILFNLYKDVSEYAKSILAGMEITWKEYKRVRRIGQEYVVYGDYQKNISRCCLFQGRLCNPGNGD